MEKALAYSDIYLAPSFSRLSSRSLADVSTKLGDKTFQLPVLPANMVCSIDERKARWLSQNDYFYVMHRFGDTLKFVQNAVNEGWKTISISVGVKEEDKKLISRLAGFVEDGIPISPLPVDYITIDIAHGHCEAMIDMIRHINFTFAKRDLNPFIIAGNVATPAAVEDLAKWGADAVKVGIGGGGSCSTKNKTGFHVPMFTCVKECVTKGGGREEIQNNPNYFSHSKVPIIADGGVRENGDFVKALVAGATMVMAGSCFAACEDSPAESVYKENKTYCFDTGPKTYQNRITHKRYFGSASARSKGENKHVEGFEIDLPCNGMSYATKLQEIKEDLKSAVSYAGGRDLSILPSVVCVIA